MFNIPGYVYNRGLYCDVVPYIDLSVFFRGALAPFLVNLSILMMGLVFQLAVAVIAHRCESCCSGESDHS